MSDLLIKGVKMPETCSECQSTLGLFCDECPLFKDFPKEFTGESELLGHTRLSNCPLVEIPPHGRLIDADRLENIFWDILNKPDEYDKPLHDMMLELQTAPTVIESEEQGNKSKSVERRGTTIIEGYADDGGLMPAT